MGKWVREGRARERKGGGACEMEGRRDRSVTSYREQPSGFVCLLGIYAIEGKKMLTFFLFSILELGMNIENA